MKKLTIAVVLLLTMTTQSPAFANDDVANRGNKALAFAETVAGPQDRTSTVLSDNLALRHQSAAGKGVSVSAKFVAADGRNFDLEMHPTYGASESSTTSLASTSISDDQSRLFVASTTAASMRIISQTFSKISSTHVDYKTNLPRDAYLISVPDLGFQILSKDGTYYGTLANPWAFDAKMMPLKTSFSLHNGLLSQTIAVTEGTSYPVTSDPSWTYGYDITYIVDESTLSVRQSKRTPNQVTAKLKTCFNCYFPISGAPATYPYVGQTMPLVIQHPYLFWVTMPAPVVVSSLATNGWTFTAKSGHVDGAGSKISFLWYSDVNGFLHLLVQGSIVNPDPCDLTAFVCQSVYPSEARKSWYRLFVNVTR